MTFAGVRVGLGARFLYDGEIIEVVELHAVHGTPEALIREARSDSVRRIAMNELMFTERSRFLSEDGLGEPERLAFPTTSLLWSAATETARDEARGRAAHVREVLTGYRSGTALASEPYEPRSSYLPHLPRGTRERAKAKELGLGLRTIERWVSRYEKEGETGLLPQPVVETAPISRRFELFTQIALDIMREQVEKSRPTKDFVFRHAKARLIGTYGAGVVPIPSKTRAYEILSELNKLCPLFTLSTKRNRDIAGRPVMPYGKLHPARPGEYLLMDTTPLDVFALDPHTLQWVGVQLTVAMDWYSRCITGLRLTPVSTKAIDAAAVLYQSFRPVPAGRDWPVEAVWPPHGVPRSVLVEADALDPASVFAANPAVVPETLVVDHGRIYVGEHLTSACRRLGISIQPARVRVAHDKGPVERFFRTVREGFLLELPGYKGPDLYSRGVSPEREAVFFIDELEALLREWIAAVYHRRPHDGIGETGLWALKMSPAQMFEHGVTRAGYLEAPRDPYLAYHFLAVEWRTIQHYGFEIDGRYYRGPGLQGYVAGEKSPFHERGGRWPVHVDPDDIRQVYFFDLKNTNQWHPLAWTEAAMCDGPMNEDGLHFARDLVRAKHHYFDDKLALAELLERRLLSQGHTMAERRAALRLSREQSTLSIDAKTAVTVAELPTAQRLLHGDDPGFEDELDDDPLIDDGHFYDEVLEDV